MIDIVDLIDEQLSAGEPYTGYQFGDPQYPLCPHCHRHWHGLPITQRVAEMYMIGMYIEGYDAAADDTPVVCEGSTFIGPQRASHPERRELSFSFGIAEAWAESLRSTFSRWIIPSYSWTFVDPEPVELPPCPPDVSVEFGPQNWHFELQATPQLMTLPGRLYNNSITGYIHRLWPAFTKPDYPVPISPGLDFDQFQPAEQHGPKRRRLDGRRQR